MKKVLLLLSLILPVMALAQDITAHYKVYDVKQQRITDLSAIIADMAKADVLFFGEEHNDSIGHALESALFRQLATVYRDKAVLSMEMFHTDVQQVMNEYLLGVISEKNFIKEGRAWNNYKDYKPMVHTAKEMGLQVIAANAAARYSNAVTMNGLEVLQKLDAVSRKNIAPLPIDTATGRYYDKFVETLGGHSMGGMKVYQTQNFWDATMAWSIASFIKRNAGSKVFHVNGRFHSDEKLGTYAKLQRYASRLKMLNISCFSAADFASPDWKNYSKLGDYIIVTDPGIKRSY